MTDLAAHGPFQLYALVSSLLLLKMLLLAFGTGVMRGMKGVYTREEDVRAFKGQLGEETDVVDRMKRAHGNSLENEPLFILVGLLYVLTGGSMLGVQAYGFAFLGLRIVHSLTYVAAVQPFRTLSWMTSWLCLVGMSVSVLLASI